MFNIIMNFISLVAFAVVVLMAYNLMDIEDEGGKKKTVTYVVMAILCVFVACSLMKTTIQEVIPDNHYVAPNENKKVEEVIPNSEPELNNEPETEDEWLNTDLPDGMYYLGVQIVDVTPMDNGTYLYSFDVVDDPNWLNNIYLYESEKELNTDVPYMLTMDSLGDDDKLNDQIVVVWACVE